MGEPKMEILKYKYPKFDFTIFIFFHSHIVHMI